MKIGLISDLHADIASLRGALALLDQADADAIVCCADVVERGAEGGPVVQLLRERSIPCIQGNHDENAIRHARLSANRDDEPQLSLESLDFLQRLPAFRLLTFSGIRVMLAHAIPSDNGGAAFQDASLSKLSKRFKKDLARVEAEIVVIGHTHYPFDVTYRAKWILNPGSVCNLQDRDSHTCGILDLSSLTYSVLDVLTGECCNHFVAQID